GRPEVQLKRVNPSLSPTRSTRESEWTKAEVVLHAASGCPRGTHLIRETDPLELDPNPWLGYFTIVRS
ncbi:hypothetical protein H5410_027199, partial [Solanum commersonii]